MNSKIISFLYKIPTKYVLKNKEKMFVFCKFKMESFIYEGIRYGQITHLYLVTDRTEQPVNIFTSQN